MVDLSSYKKLYIKTAQEHVHNLEKDLALFLKQPANTEALKELHRAAHSLKSESSVMGHPCTASLCKMLEDIFYALKEKTIQITPELRDALELSVRELKGLIHLIENEGKEEECPGILERLSQLTHISVTKF